MDSTGDGDVLIDLSVEEMIELKEMYKNVEEAYYVYTIIDQAIRWRLAGNEKLRITSPNNSWRRDGSIITFMDSSQNQLIFTYSFDKTYANIREGFTKTKRIRRNCIFLNIHESYVHVIFDAIKSLGKEIQIIHETNSYKLNIEVAASFEADVPPETYVDKLNSTHVKKIDDLWYHQYEGSDVDTRMYIENNVGYGLFRKTDHELIAWALQGAVGHINNLETVEGYRGKGYGKLMARIMAKHIAQSGHTPVATVLVENEVSNNLFRKMGFEYMGKIYHIIV